MDLCNKFSVDHYPYLVWGPPTKFNLVQWKPKQENSELELIDDGRTADRLLKWINKKMGRLVAIYYALVHSYISMSNCLYICSRISSITCVYPEVCNHYMHALFLLIQPFNHLFFFCSSFNLDDKKYENESMLPKNASDPEQVQLHTGFLE